MDNRKLYTCCFTGHRPYKLPWGYNEHGIRFFIFKNKLQKIIKRIIKKGYIYFISGMALGADIICAEIIVALKKKHPNIQLECAIPCLNQTCKWKSNNLKRYNYILSKADKLTYVSSTYYYNGCMQKRNLYMIDNSSLLVAIYNGKSGGTQQTITLAKEKNLTIQILKP